MQNFKKYSVIFLMAMCFSQGFETGIGNFIPITPSSADIDMDNDTPNFSMNHGFSLLANSGMFGTSTRGVYSNQARYKFSDKLSVNSTFNIMNSNQSFYKNHQKFDVDYELGLEYKLSENSRIIFQFSNLGKPQNNQPYMLKTGF